MSLHSASVSSAVDLSSVATPAPDGTPSSAAEGPTLNDITRNGPMPTEFTVAVAGQGDAVEVLLGFGHVRWQFTPDLADDLASHLRKAARHARVLASDTAQPTRIGGDQV